MGQLVEHKTTYPFLYIARTTLVKGGENNNRVYGGGVCLLLTSARCGLQFTMRGESYTYLLNASRSRKRICYFILYPRNINNVKNKVL